MPPTTYHLPAVAQGREAVLLSVLLGLPGSRDRCIADLTDAARAHLESTSPSTPSSSSTGWSTGWQASVKDLRLLIGTALDYFIHCDLYHASCRFIRAAKGSFGLAVACSLEPDRLCVGAWGQPMALGFSPTHSAVLYGSETTCAMLPLVKQPAGDAGDQTAQQQQQAAMARQLKQEAARPAGMSKLAGGAPPTAATSSQQLSPAAAAAVPAHTHHLHHQPPRQSIGARSSVDSKSSRPRRARKHDEALVTHAQATIAKVSECV